jgi:hypothetical protein
MLGRLSPLQPLRAWHRWHQCGDFYDVISGATGERSFTEDHLFSEQGPETRVPPD